MSNSPLINGTLLSPNNSGTRKKPITKITPHHAAGVLSARNLAGCFMGNREASANYCIGNEGALFLSLDESKRAWTSSSAANDQQAVTVEISNSATGGDWPIGAKAYATFINLCVDLCKRNPGIKQKNGKPGLYFDGTPNGSLTHHSMFANTSCPGPYLLKRMTQICEEVNRRLNGDTETPKPETPPTSGYKVGDIITFSGGAVYKSSGATTASSTVGASRCKVTAVANGKHPYHCISEDGKGVYGWVDASNVSSTAAPAFKPYAVRVDIPDLTIRTGPGTNHATVGKFTGKGVFTIVEEASGTGATKWGLLKAYQDKRNGWVSLDYAKKC